MSSRDQTISQDINENGINDDVASRNQPETNEAPLEQKDINQLNDVENNNSTRRVDRTKSIKSIKGK